MQQDNSDERRWHLAARVLSGTLPADEQAEWDTYLLDTAFHEEFARVTAYWDKLGTLPYDRIDTGKDWQQVLTKMRRQAHSQRTVTFMPWLRYAAVIAAVVTASFLGWWLGHQGTGPADAILTTVEAPAGSKTYITLPDSSVVWLNAGSRITFARDFGVNTRNLGLEGEAFFDVKKRAVPFTVHTNAYDVAVLGTAFNIKSYNDDDEVTTTLVRGSLRITREGLMPEADNALLVPGDKLTYHKTNTTGHTATLQRNVNTDAEIAWKDGWLAVSGESMADLARKMERLYDISIHFQDNALKDYRFSGRIRQLSLEQVLKAVSLTSPVEFRIDEKQVTLWENKKVSPAYKSLQNHP